MYIIIVIDMIDSYVNPTWPFYFEEIFCATCIIISYTQHFMLREGGG